MKRNLVILLLLAVGVISLWASTLGRSAYRVPGTVFEPTPQAASTTFSPPSSGWTSFQNIRSGYKIEYPAAWSRDPQSGDAPDILFGPESVYRVIDSGIAINAGCLPHDESPALIQTVNATTTVDDLVGRIRIYEWQPTLQRSRHVIGYVVIAISHRGRRYCIELSPRYAHALEDLELYDEVISRLEFTN